MALTNKPLAFSGIILATAKDMRKNWIDFLLIILFISIVVIAVITLWVLLYFAFIYFNWIFFNNFLIFKIAFNFLFYILTFIIAVLAQILVINKLVNRDIKFKANIKNLKLYFKNFLLLAIFIYFLYLLASLPLYAIILLAYLKTQPIFSILALILSLILLIVLSTYIVFTPFILIDKNSKALATIKQSFALVHNHFFNIFYKLLIIACILLIINGLAIIVIKNSFIGAILSMVVFIFLIIFSYNYLYNLYADIKKISNG